jgi:hypothetical protein
MKNGEIRCFEINGAKRVYFFAADGYMSGTIIKSISNKLPNLYAKAEGEFYDSIKQRGEGADIWAEFDYLIQRRGVEDFGRAEYEGRTDRNDTILEESSTSDSTRSEKSYVEHNYSAQKVEELTKQLKERYGKAS